MKAGPLIVFIVNFLLIVVSFLIIFPITRMGLHAYKHYMWISSLIPLLISLAGIIWAVSQSPEKPLLRRAGIIGNSILVLLMSFKFYQFLVLFVF